MTKKSWKEPTLDDLLADPILDLLLARDRVDRKELLAVVEHARRALACSARDRFARAQEPAGADFPPARPVADRAFLCLTY